ncbi:acetolactate synthase large subunit [Granulosicoccus antarcticus]|uniref:Acetolactate synthase n=1 Tax=Granulosicoccus antarcticus IMCC3135 TaxID=1192854 RepID=A0A2Z2P0C5_9GAMM|nr:acetolactate synthase large subunit [Granulosicoccus antarcticus]ASJ73617.1 Acetolactate synthase [Granulosicoccus antarcticus IMCC3135]
MKTSDLFVKALENEGVKYIFGIPGEENLDFLDSLRKSSIELILTRHEQAAGFMAANYGRLTGEPGVCLSTLGPGATNFVTAAAYAQLGGMPMIMLGGQKPIRKSKQGRFQIVDVVSLMAPVTKYSRQVVDGNNLPSMVREAFRITMDERPGAAYIELPEDIAEEEVSAAVFDVVGHRRPNADDQSIDAAVKMIKAAKLPLLLIGAGANRKRTSESLKEFIDQTGIYFFNTQMGKGVVDERHERFIGTAALSDHDYLHCAIERADLIINVGHDVIEKPPFIMEKNGKHVIHINFDAASVDDVYFPQLNVVGDISSTISSLTNKLGKLDQDFSFFQRVRDDVDSHVTKYFKDERFPVLPQALVSVLRDHLEAEDIVTLDNGVYKIWFARNYECYAPNTLLLDNALATMGAGLPSAMAAKLLNPDRKVVSVNGDGGFLMNSQELETAVRMDLDLVVIILTDNAYGMIKWKQEGVGFENFGLDFNNPDFVQYANSFGATGHKAESYENFVEILGTALNGKGVHVIDLPIDYSLNHHILNVLLKESACIV